MTPLGDRPCILDDSYTFHRDGTFEANTAGTIFVDAIANGGWKNSEICADESDPNTFIHEETGEDVSDFAGGNYSYTFDSGSDVLVINGSGSYIGLASKTNAGDNPIPVASKTYNVFGLADGDIADTLNLALQADGTIWNFYLVSYDNIDNLPAIPVSGPRADFGFNKEGLSVNFQNFSSNATSYSWEFGDGGMSSDRDPTYTYGAAGDYVVTLRVQDGAGASDMISKTVSVSDADFTADVMSSADGKIWTLAGEGSYKVGPVPGSGEFWAGLDANGVAERQCQMDDEFIFSDGGALDIDVKDQVWAEDYMGGSFSCISPGDLVAPFDAFAGGSHTFEVLEATGDELAKLRVIGTGAYVGFNKPFNGAELPGDASGTPASDITYDVIGFTSTPSVDEVVLAIDYTQDNSGYWTITIQSRK